MLNCGDVEILIQDYLEGYILPSQRELLESHLEACAACRELLSEMVRLDAEFDGVPAVDVPSDLNCRILTTVPSMAEGPAAAGGRNIGGFVSLLAAAAAVLVVGLFLGGRYDLMRQGWVNEVELVYSAPGAASVAVVGDFNGWDPEKNVMVRPGGKGPWRARLKLSSGIYQYGFLVDGTLWANDPRAEKVLEDGFGRENSLLLIDG